MHACTGSFLYERGSTRLHVYTICMYIYMYMHVQGASCMNVDQHGCTALHMASWRGFTKAAKPLLDAGAPV